MNADCSPYGTVVVRVAKQAKHGRVSISDAMANTSYHENNQRFHCNIEKRPVLAVTYEPDRGYLGADKAVVDVIYPNGVNRITYYEIAVK